MSTARKQRPLNFIIPLVVYPFDVLVSIGQTDEELKKVMSKYDVEWSDNMKLRGAGLFYMTERNQSMIRMRDFPSDNVGLGYLQHEIFHATTFILDRIGMKMILLKSDEAYAYLAQYLTVEIYKKITK